MDRRGNLRASDSDRDHVVDRLRHAASEGRIVAEELEERVTAALTARTYRELEAIVADLPGTARQRARTTSSARAAGRWAFSTVRAYPILGLVLIPVLAVTLAMIIAITVLWTLLVALALILGGRSRLGPWTGQRRVRSARHPGGSWI